MNNSLYTLLDIEPKEVVDRLVENIRIVVGDWDGVVIGVSGGIDSAVALKLLSLAIGKEKILCLILPERDTALENVKNARFFANLIGVRSKVINISGILSKLGCYKLVPRPFFLPRSWQERYVHREHAAYIRKYKRTPLLDSLSSIKDQRLRKVCAYLRMKNRLRMLILYKYADMYNYLVCGTLNKTERKIGLYVRYGDNAADFMPLKDLYKTQLKVVAKYLRIPKKLIKKKPTPDLLPGLTDEELIQLPYCYVDAILVGLEYNHSVEAIAKALNLSQKKVNYIKSLCEAAR